MKAEDIYPDYWVDVIQRRVKKQRAPNKKNACIFSLGGGFYLYARASIRKKFMAVDLEISVKNSRYHFKKLEKNKKAIEASYGQVLHWDSGTARHAKSVFITSKKEAGERTDPENKHYRKEQHDWLIEQMKRMKKAFAPYLPH